MEFKGTKGVWSVNPRASRNVRCGNITIANCSSGQNGDNEEEEKNNAKLIASAVEMFEQIKKLREAILSEDYIRMLAESQSSKELLNKITE